MLIGNTVDIGMDVSGDIYGYYHVTATDYAGNEGSPSPIQNAYTTVRQAGQLPTACAPKQNRPNPFGAQTMIRFDLRESVEPFAITSRSTKTYRVGQCEDGT